MSDFEDFVYLELPKRPVMIRGAEASGDPNSSALSKVINAPDGTYYLQLEDSSLWVKKPTIWEQITAGAAGSDERYVSRIAGHDISGHMALRLDSDGEFIYCDSSNVAHANTLIGVSTGAATTGASCQAQRFGLLTEPTWTWTPGNSVFVGTAGVLTQTAPTSGFVCEVGYAVSATILYIDPKPSFILA